MDSDLHGRFEREDGLMGGKRQYRCTHLHRIPPLAATVFVAACFTTPWPAERPYMRLWRAPPALL